MLVRVEDPDDPRVADFLGLRDHELRRRREAPGGDLAGVFVAEGEIVIGRAIAAGYRLRAVLADGRRDPLVPAWLPAGVPVYVAGEGVQQRITGYHLHRGLIASFDRRPVPGPAAVLRGARRAVVLENVNNPTNLGVILRSAAALGVDAALLDPSTCDPLYRRAARVSMGAVYQLPWARLDPLPAGFAPLRDAGFRLVALTPDESAAPVETLAGCSGRVALVLGSEGRGLRDATLAAVDERVRIPMHAGVDSLNVGAAAAVACYVLGRVPAAVPAPPTGFEPVPPP